MAPFPEYLSAVLSAVLSADASADAQARIYITVLLLSKIPDGGWDKSTKPSIWGTPTTYMHQTLTLH